jgi:hypothetical protein
LCVDVNREIEAISGEIRKLRDRSQCRGRTEGGGSRAEDGHREANPASDHLQKPRDRSQFPVAPKTARPKPISGGYENRATEANSWRAERNLRPRNMAPNWRRNSKLNVLNAVDRRFSCVGRRIGAVDELNCGAPWLGGGSIMQSSTLKCISPK